MLKPKTTELLKTFVDWWKEMKIVEWKNVETFSFLCLFALWNYETKFEFVEMFSDWWNGLDNVETRLWTGKNQLTKGECYIYIYVHMLYIAYRL